MNLFTYNSRKLAEDEVEKRRCQSITYTEPLPLDMPNIQIFLKEFYEIDIFTRGLEFKAELEKYSDSVGEHYRFLVPDQVSFDEFFSRYYYRCDATNIMRDWSNLQQARAFVPCTSSPTLSIGSIVQENCFIPASPRVPPSPHKPARRSPQTSRSKSIRIPQSPFSSTRSENKIHRSSIGSNTFSFMVKEKQQLPIFPTDDDERSARNDMALKLLAEAKGSRVDHV
jgi:hypothetical protein